MHTEVTPMYFLSYLKLVSAAGQIQFLFNVVCCLF